MAGPPTSHPSHRTDSDARAPGVPSTGLASGYAPLPGVYDELIDTGAGAVRAPWQPLLADLDRMGRREVDRRWERARELIHENGVSYNVYGDSQGLDRPWSLSPIPVVVSGADWATLSAGLAQRAQLLDRVLADLYGPQRTLMDGVLPAELVFSHPSFLRPCHGVTVPRDRWLPLYGGDVVRAPDGSFRVLADRVQAPSGAGYALENRIVVSRTLPEQFRACNVERLARFFRALQQALRQLAPHNRDNPRIVLLSPGPFNATYFEQAYLAQYLGYTLVNGGDLTVRDDRVFLKTLSGLQPVDVIFRRVNDDFCDPLELRPDSVLGVPGLVEAVRQGHVAIANPLGTGLLQTTAILAYLPALCRYLLGESLRLESVPTYWCGDPNALPHVLARLHEMVVKPTFPDGRSRSIFASTLSPAERDALATRIRARPRDWVAQEVIAGSTTPALTADGLAPRALVLRSYAVASPDGWTVMPGALARVAAAAGVHEISMQQGAGSQDTWVLASAPVSAFSLLPAAAQDVPLSRGGGDLPSRTADNLYWLGRYAERADGIVRLARVAAARLQDVNVQSENGISTDLDALFSALAAQTDLEYTPALPVEVGQTHTLAEEWLRAALLDADRAGSLVAVARATLRVARMVRERLSGDTWRVLASLDDEVQALDLALRGREPAGSSSAIAPALDRIVLALAAFQGLAMESMTRGQAWRFLDLGRRLERAMTLLLLLRSTLLVRREREAPLLEAILDVADSGMTYRRRYPANLQAAPVLDLLLTDESNPRSALFQLLAVSDHITALPAAGTSGVRRPQERIALGALADLQLADVEALARAGRDGRRAALDALLERLSKSIPAISDSLSSSYLNHAVVSRHLAGEVRAR